MKRAKLVSESLKDFKYGQRKDPNPPYYTGGSGEKRVRPGYEEYDMLEALSKASQGLTHQDIKKIAYELGYGEGTFDPKEHRDHWTEPRSEWIQKYTYMEDGKHYINELGRSRLKQLERKWG